MHKLVDIETARDIAERLSDLNETIEKAKDSGPAAGGPLIRQPVSTTA
jgi:hypothetical protein